MKPKTYHQLKMTEIAKQKKPNAPSKSEFMSDLTDLEKSIMSSSLTSDLESAVKKSVASSMEDFQRDFRNKWFNKLVDLAPYYNNNRVQDISSIGESEKIEDLENSLSTPDALFDIKKKQKKSDAELEKRWLQEFSSFKKECAKMIHEMQKKIEAEVDKIRETVRLDINNWREGMQEHLIDFDKSSTVTNKRFDVVEKSVAAQRDSCTLIESKIEGNFGVLNVKVNTMEEQILELRKEIQSLKSKPELAPGDGVVNAEVGSHDEVGSHGGGKGQFSDQDAKKLRILLNNYDRDESCYWSRSLKLSNIGYVNCDEGSKFGSIKKLLDSFGIGALISHAESFFLYSSNRDVRVTFKTILDMQHYCRNARKALKELNNRTVAIHTLVSPKFLDKKKELLRMGKSLKSNGVIVRYEVELYKGMPMLKTWSQHGVKYFDVGDIFISSVEIGANSANTNFHF